MARDVTWAGRGEKRLRALRLAGGPLLVVIDVDGTLTDGRQYVDAGGQKLMKAFGVDDTDAIRRWIEHDAFKVVLVTADDHAATRARARHIGVNLLIARPNSQDRLRAIGDAEPNLDRVVYVADGYHDAGVMRACALGIAPANAWPATLRAADAVTSRNGGERAVALALDAIGTRAVHIDARAVR